MTTIETLRQFKIGEYAVFDFVVSYLFILLISPLLSKLFLKIRISIPKINWLFLTLPLSILIHVLVDNITPMTGDFLDPSGHYFIKFIIVVSFLLGLRGISIVEKKKK